MRRVFVMILAGGLAFGAGVVVDRYGLPHSAPSRFRTSTGISSLGENDPDLLGNNSESVSAERDRGGKSGTSSNSVDAVVAALRNAMNRPNDRRGYLTASKLIDAIEPSKIRAVIASF